MFTINITKLPKSEIEIEGEINAEILESYYSRALKKLGENLKLDGFRPGKIPENVLISNIPEIKILEEMAQMALSDYYPKIIEKEKLDVINRPEISITKLARKNPLGFKIKTTIMPEIALPDYKNLAKEVILETSKENKKIEVTDKDIEDTILDIRKSRAPKIQMSDIKNSPTEDIKGENISLMSNIEKDKVSDTKNPVQNTPELPELNDEFVKSLGPFKDVTHFKEKLRENIKLEKENIAKEKIRLKIMEKILEKTEIETPNILIEIELDKILYRMESDITSMGLKFEDYLKHLKKTTEDLRTEFKNDAEKKAKLGLILNKIRELEKIKAEEKEVEEEVARILNIYKDADKERATIHAQNVLTNEKIFQFLENQ